jgi:hypothetical protein
MKFLLSYIMVIDFRATLLKNSAMIGLIPITGFIATLHLKHGFLAK